ncbi:hypothetical protein GCM10009762_23060 [Dermacoccus barathri]|uniref:Uncharacterized protein n=1 Tax=Dermacoccus barathri TaxID=322601 RepID=A0ABN2C0T4_9MICO
MRGETIGVCPYCWHVFSGLILEQMSLRETACTLDHEAHGSPVRYNGSGDYIDSLYSFPSSREPPGPAGRTSRSGVMSVAARATYSISVA